MRHEAPVLPNLDDFSPKTPGEVDCPRCGNPISLSEALRNQFAEKFEKEFKRKEQAALAAQRDQFAKAQKMELEDLKNQIFEKEKKLDEARRAELELRKKARDLEEKEKSLEIELMKKMDSEKRKLEDEISRRVHEEQRLKLAEKDKQLEDFKKQVAELQRKSEITSQQLQGEVLELELEAALAKNFPFDAVEPVAKGVRGGDIIHRVLTTSGVAVGAIVWETKRTKNWTDTWIDKIKEDQRSISAECAVIVSDILPKGIAGLSFYEGVWICDTRTSMGLAMALRQHLIRVHAAKASVAGKDAKMELMYRYLTGTQFVQSVQSMAEVLRDMRATIQDEKRAYGKIWARREKQVEELALNAVSIYGSVQGIVGGALPVIDTLELPGSNQNAE